MTDRAKKDTRYEESQTRRRAEIKAAKVAAAGAKPQVVKRNTKKKDQTS